MKHILIICIITIYGIANLAGQTQKEIDLFNEGIKFQQSEKYNEAVNTFNTLISMAPTNASYWYNRGVAKLQLKNYGEAVVDLNKCIYIDTSISEAYFNRHLAYKFTSNFQFALADISKYMQNG
jgi:tetratricopeptide (TPR) repeat protein